MPNGPGTAAGQPQTQAELAAALQRAESDLRAANRRFEAAFDNMPIALTVTSLATGRFVDCNTTFLAQTGYAREEVLGRTPEDLGLWLDPSQRQARFEAFRDGRRPPDIEAEYRARDGRRIVGMISSSLLEFGGEPCVMSTVSDITERIVTAEALADAERQLRLVTDSAPVLLAYCDAQARYRFVNQPYADRFGLRPSDVTGQHIGAVIGARAFGAIEPYVARAVAGEDVDFEIEVPYPGNPRVMHCGYRPERGPAGQVTGFVAAIVDVTEDRRAQEALRESREMLAMAQRTAGAGVWEIDLARGSGRWSPECHALYGTDPARFEPTAAGWDALVHPEDRDRVRAAGRRAVETGDEFNQEFRIRHPARGERWLWEVGRVTRDAAGRALRLAGITLDITDRKRVEQLLRESEQRFRSFADSAPAMLWVTDTQGQCTYLSRRWYEFTGQAPDTGLGRGWLAAVHPDDRGPAGRAFVGANERQAPFAVEHRVRYADGTYRWVLDAGSPRFDEEGRFAGYIGSLFDITARRQAEERLQETDRRKDEFLASLAHELRNPLAPLRNGVEILAKGTADPALLAQLNAMMQRQLGQLVRLVDDLLDVSRISRNKIELQKGPVELSEVVHAAAETVVPGVRDKRLDFRLDLPAGAVHLLGDQARLVQALSNVLGNAVKYTPPGGSIRLHLRCEAGQAILEVADTGRGIAPEMLGRIFEPFVQQDTSEQRAHGGLGLGLTIARRLVEMHGGTLDAASPGPGQGATFTLVLPLAEVQPVVPSAPPAPATEARRVLIVDDNRDAADSLALSLELLGHEVRVAYEADAALRTGADWRPQAVLLDIGMPGVSGYEVAARIRAQDWGERVRLIALTGFGREEDRRRTRAAGFDDHLVKPASVSVVLAVLAASA